MPGPLRRDAIVFFVAATLATCAAAFGQPEDSPDPPAPASPRVVAAGPAAALDTYRPGGRTGPFHERIGVGPVAVVVRGLENLIGDSEAIWPELRLVLNGLAVEGLRPLPPDRGTDILIFDLQGIDRANDPAWQQLLASSRGPGATVSITICCDEQGAFLPSDVRNRPMKLVNTAYGLLFMVGFLSVAAGLVSLARRAGLLSELGPTTRVIERRPYSPARVQMAWWFFLVLGSYPWLILLHGTAISLPNSALLILAIAAGTFVAAEVAQHDRREEVGESKGFFIDLLCQPPDQIALHRFQMVLLSLALGAIFAVLVASTLTMPDFGIELVLLLAASCSLFCFFEWYYKPGRASEARHRVRPGPEREVSKAGRDKAAVFDVFLSHNSRDKPAVRQLADALESRGLRPWLDERELVPGRPWQEALEEIVRSARSAAVMFGAAGLGPWEEPEMRACLSEFVNRRLPVIPVLLPGAPDRPELPLFLKSFTWVDLRDGFTDEGLKALGWGITGKKPARVD